MVRIPYWLGETYFKLFEMGWELLVIAYALVAGLLYYAPYALLYNRLGGGKYPFRDEDKDAIGTGFAYGVLDAIVSGWYLLLTKVFGEGGETEIGSGLCKSLLHLKILKKYRFVLS